MRRWIGGADIDISVVLFTLGWHGIALFARPAESGQLESLINHPLARHEFIINNYTQHIHRILCIPAWATTAGGARRAAIATKTLRVSSIKGNLKHNLLLNGYFTRMAPSATTPLVADTPYGQEGITFKQPCPVLDGLSDMGKSVSSLLWCFPASGVAAAIIDTHQDPPHIECIFLLLD